MYSKIFDLIRNLWQQYSTNVILGLLSSAIYFKIGLWCFDNIPVLLVEEIREPRKNH